MDELFPKIKKSIEDLIEDEEGSIPGNRLLMLGAMVIVLGSILTMDGLAGHRSHSSHRSHRSSNSGHTSHYSGHASHASSRTHTNHASHDSHESHQSHISHTSHSNTAAHSNSRYSAEGDVTYAPPASSIPSVAAPAVSQTQDTFHLPDVNQNIQNPNSTPTSGIMPTLAVPSATNTAQFDSGDLKTPPASEAVE